MGIVIGNNQVIYCKDREGKDGRNYPRGYLEINGALYRLDVNMNPHFKNPKENCSVIITARKCEKRDNGFGNQGNSSGRGSWNGGGRGGGNRGGW